MIYLGASFLYCHRNQSSDHRNLSTEHTEDTDFLSTEDTFFLVATLEILEEIFNKIWPMARNQSSEFRRSHGKRFLLKIILKIFVKIYTIGYFCRDSAKNKFLDLFSALTAPKIRAVGDP